MNRKTFLKRFTLGTAAALTGGVFAKEILEKVKPIEVNPITKIPLSMRGKDLKHIVIGNDPYKLKNQISIIKKSYEITGTEPSMIYNMNLQTFLEYTGRGTKEERRKEIVEEYYKKRLKR